MIVKKMIEISDQENWEDAAKEISETSSHMQIDIIRMKGAEVLLEGEQRSFSEATEIL